MPVKTSLLIFLFELGFGFKFNIIGEISISELFLLIYTPFIFPKIRWTHANDLKKITIAYFCLLCTQIFSEIMVGNEISNSLKGIAITIISYLHFLFLFYNLTKDKNLILIVILSQIAEKLLFGTSIEEQSAEDILAGEAAVYLKFYIAPLIILIFLAISILYNNKKMPIIFSVLGITLIILGARSSGGMALFSAMIAYIMENKSIISNKKFLALASCLLLVISYSFYVYYVNLVLSGKITSGNSKQLLICTNPYNPIELLMAGRSEVWIGWQAFMDRFWFGHGAWAYDTTGYYQRLMFIITDNLSELTKGKIDYNYQIPAHSVLIAMGMKNGIGAFLTFGFLLIFFLKKGAVCLQYCKKKYLLVLSYFILNLFWHALFSPSSHFRLTIPIAFAIILTLYLEKPTKNILRAQ